MADLFADVDISLPEVPVNKAPLVDDTDFTTIEEQLHITQPVWLYGGTSSQLPELTL